MTRINPVEIPSESRRFSNTHDLIGDGASHADLIWHGGDPPQRPKGELPSQMP